MKRPEKKETPPRLTTCGARQKNDEDKGKTTSSTLPLYPARSGCQDTTPRSNRTNGRERVQIYVYGICEPVNPTGYACWGWIALNDHGHVVGQDSGCVGHGQGMSNSVAEYHAVIRPLEWAKTQGLAANLFTNSRAIVKQVTGEWLCTASHLIALWEHAIALLDETASSVTFVSRKEVSRAEALSRQAYQRAREGEAP